MSYSYLDGTATGNLLSGQTPYPTSAPGNYVPGQGTAPYASLATSGLTNVSSGAVNGATNIPYDPNSGLSPAAYQNWASQMIANGQGALVGGGGGITAGASPQGPGVSTYPAYQGGASAGSTGTTGSDGLTVIGQQSAADLARNASIMNAPVGGGTSSGGAGGSGGGAGSTSGTSGSSFGGGLFQPAAASGGSSPSSVPINNAPYIGGVGYNSPGGLQSAPQSQGGVLAMQQADPRSAMNQYQNTAGYQMLGNDQTSQYQQSPGYQFAVNEALGQVQRQGASRGLLDSGRQMQNMTDRAVGMAQQDYGNWWNRQNSLYSDYQNRLQGLAGGSVGAEQANQLGTNQAQGTYQTGSNLASLFGNQGSAGFGGITNTGAAQSNNMNQAGATQAQMQAANQSTQLAGATLQRQF